jgi:Zn-dependent peptidase ImmA (M78 family)/DNA-binding XRE family transcriptional regulator
MGDADRAEVRAHNAEMLTLARESRGLTQAELAERCGISQGRISKMESGLVHTTMDEIAALSRALDYPDEFFFQTDRIYGPSTSEFYHRKRSAVPAKVLDKIHAQLNIRRIHIAQMVRSADLPSAFPRLDPEEFRGDINEIARAVRAMWQLPRGPIKSVVTAIENAGGVVVRMRFDTEKVDAVSWWVPGNPPVFAVNETLPADRERLTLCHELGHLVMHAVPRPNMEEEANQFAGSFLMPPGEIRADLRDVDLHRLAALKQHWRTSMAAILKQAMRTGAISDGKARWIWIQMGRMGYRTREPAELDFPKETPSLLHELVDLHTRDLGYSPTEFADMLKLFEHEVLTSYPIEPQGPPPKRLRVVK